MTHRFSEIDYTKGMLVMSMVFGHVITFLDNGQSSLLNQAQTIINLVSFSGFLFCFGFVHWIAYLQKPHIPWMAVLRTSLKCYLAFVVSGFAGRVLVSGKPAGWDLLIRLGALRDITESSEYLLPFALLSILGAAFAPVIKMSTRNGRNLIISTFAFLISTFLPHNAVYDPFVGLFIGGQGFYFFPIIQYLPLFLLGAYLARWNYQYSVAAAGAATTFIAVIAIVAGLQIANIPISRFPPSAFWIYCSATLVYLFYGLGRLVSANFVPNIIRYYLNAVGQNALYYLLLSNLALFAAKALGKGEALRAWQTLVFYFALMATLFFIHYIVIDLERANRAINRPA